MNQKEAVHERLKEYACVAPDQMMQKLQINAEGITQEEAIIRRQKYGNNAPSAKNKDTMFYCIRRAFVNPFSTILFFLGLISLVTDVFLSSDYQKNLTAVLIIFSMLILSGIVRLTQELHSKRVADELFQLVHTTVQVLRDGQWWSYLLLIGSWRSDPLRGRRQGSGRFAVNRRDGFVCFAISDHR